MNRRQIWGMALIFVLGAGWYLYGFVVDRAPPHRFIVKLDEDAKSAELVLGNSDGNKMTRMDGRRREFSSARLIGDASGFIRIEWPDGSETRCLIGYITNGEREPHIAIVKNRGCSDIRSEV